MKTPRWTCNQQMQETLMFPTPRKGNSELLSRRDSVAQHLLPKGFISTPPFYTKKIRCQGMQSQIRLSIQLLMNSFPGLLHPSLPSPLHVDNSGHDSSHSLLPISPATDASLLLLCFGPIISDSRACSFTTQIQNLSLTSAGVSARPWLSHSDAPFWQHIERRISGENLSLVSILVKEGGWMWRCRLSRLGVERLTGWDKAAETRSRAM